MIFLEARSSKGKKATWIATQWCPNGNFWRFSEGREGPLPRATTGSIGSRSDPSVEGRFAALNVPDRFERNTD
jgi:hypothetical protein